MKHTAPMKKTAARDFFLYLLAIGTLYFSVWRFIDLLFEYINVSFPDELDYWHFIDAAHSVRLDVAFLVVVFPVYLGLSWFLRKDIIKNPAKQHLSVRKFLLNFTLFLTAITIIADLVTLLNTYLEGELTVRFVLKVLVVLFVAVSVFSYYLWDLRRETLRTSKPSKLLAWTAASVVIVSILASFFIIGSPAKVRQMKFDERRVNDLQILQNEIINYWVQKDRLPRTLDDLKNDISGFVQPLDPVTEKPYGYEKKGPLAFELCATFATPSPASRNKHVPWEHVWEHAVGHICFPRTIDPELYRPSHPVKNPIPPVPFR